MQTASKSLMDSLNEMYESGWLGHELLYTQSQHVEMLWNDFSHKLADQVLIPMNTYQAQFPEMRVGRSTVYLVTCVVSSFTLLHSRKDASNISNPERMKFLRKYFLPLRTL